MELEKSLDRCCDCTDNCLDKQKCSCWRLTIERLIERPPTSEDFDKYKNYGYTNLRLMKGTVSEIIECSDECQCNADKCYNRVVQRGLQLKLQLFKTVNTGRGVRTLTDIPPGTFVISYIGEIIDEDTASKRSYRYQYTLGTYVVSLYAIWFFHVYERFFR